ncbi:MAG: response regulator [Nostoc sp. ChiSLP02]|nr:response regulator [Nostoc sp. DedSLP05]MDZ8097633.1 response regulator [Nostoc sp. DedSLP01]MDZ8186770.1 response regulator [Nostoc sp. ChiSLP02]
MSINSLATILVVEESGQELELITYHLRNKGYNVIQASNAKEALELVLEEKPDAIVTDVVMPGMSGFELCRCLKTNPTNQKIPIVICSSKNQAIHQLWAKKQGADAFIAKPYTAEQLLSAIQSVKAII